MRQPQRPRYPGDHWNGATLLLLFIPWTRRGTTKNLRLITSHIIIIIWQIFGQLLPFLLENYPSVHSLVSFMFVLLPLSGLNLFCLVHILTQTLFFSYPLFYSSSFSPLPPSEVGTKSRMWMVQMLGYKMKTGCLAITASWVYSHLQVQVARGY